jgi:hypothetical protein
MLFISDTVMIYDLRHKIYDLFTNLKSKFKFLTF